MGGKERRALHTTEYRVALLPSYFTTLGEGPARSGYPPLKAHRSEALISERAPRACQPAGVVLHSLHGAAKALVLLGVIVLQRDLQVHRLPELAFLLHGTLQHGAHAVVQNVPGNFTVGRQQIKWAFLP